MCTPETRSTQTKVRCNTQKKQKRPYTLKFERAWAGRQLSPPHFSTCKTRWREREFCIDNLLVQIHLIIEMIWWTGLAPWDHCSTCNARYTSRFSSFSDEFVTIRSLSDEFVADSLYIVYRQVFEVPWFLHLELSLDALSLRSDVISSTKMRFQYPALGFSAFFSRFRLDRNSRTCQSRS